MSVCSGKDCNHSNHKNDMEELAKADMQPQAPAPSVPAVPKVEGIKVVFMMGQALTICECGNAHQGKFCRYFKRYLDIDERGRKTKVEEPFVNCRVCNKTKSVKEHVEDYDKVMKKHAKK